MTSAKPAPLFSPVDRREFVQATTVAAVAVAAGGGISPAEAQGGKIVAEEHWTKKGPVDLYIYRKRAVGDGGAEMALRGKHRIAVDRIVVMAEPRKAIEIALQQDALADAGGRHALSPNSARSLGLSTLPAALRASAGTNWTCFGALKPASFCLQYAIICSALTCAPGFRATIALPTSPHLAS